MSALFSRPPNPVELTRFKLTLSAYQDGRGMLFDKERGVYLPGWRDFERVVTDVFQGICLESKHVFDVLIPSPDVPTMYVGISCKTAAAPKGHKLHEELQVRMELSNANAQFKAELARHGINADAGEWSTDAARTAAVLIGLIHSWHHSSLVNLKGAVGTDGKSAFDCSQRVKQVDLDRSMYLTLFYDQFGHYRLDSFDLTLPDPNLLTWSHSNRNIQGRDRNGRLILEWYPGSGGQLKYYPLFDQARWSSDIFTLQDPPCRVRPSELAASYYQGEWG